MTAIRVAAKTLFAAADLLLPRLRGPRILIYHQVGSGRSHEMNVTVDAFRRHLIWLRTHGEIVGLEEALTRRGETDSDRLFVLTFDDGYRDVIANAFPMLERGKVPFTLYLTSGPIETPDQFPEWPGEPLTWDDIRSMIGSGLVTIGAHTHAHPDMRQLAERTASDELDRSNHLISDRTGVFPKHFTYPKGWWARQAHEAVCDRYLTATLGSGASITETSHLHMLHRVPVQRSDTSALFGRKMLRGGRVENRVRRRLRGYAGP